MAATRVLIATPLYPPEPGGPATYAALLEKYLPDEHIEVSLAVFSLVRNLPKIVRHIAYFFLLIKKGRGASVVLALDPVSVGVPAYWYSRLSGKRYIVKIVGDYAWEQGTQRFGITDALDVFVKRRSVPFVVQLLRAVQTHVARGADMVIVPSNYLRGIISAWHLGHERIEVIHNAVTIDSIEPTQQIAHPYVITVGRLVSWRQFEKVIDAVVRARMTVPNLSLVIVGDGPLGDSLRAHAQDVLGEACVFTGSLSHARTLGYMKHAEALVLYSTYEGLSHVLVEGLMLGLPVIASNIQANADVLAEAGVLVDPADTEGLANALTEVVTNTARAQTLAERARSRAQDFSVHTMITRTRALLSV